MIGKTISIQKPRLQKKLEAIHIAHDVASRNVKTPLHRDTNRLFLSKHKHAHKTGVDGSIEKSWLFRPQIYSYHSNGEDHMRQFLRARCRRRIAERSA